MVFKKEEIDGHIRLSIEGALSIYEVVALREEILACFKEDSPLQVDLSQVTDGDTAGVQLLLSARKTAHQRNRALSIANLSQSMTEILEGAALRWDEITG